MTKQETAMVLAYLREFFPQGKEVTATTVEAWHSVLEPYPVELVKACARSVATSYDFVTMPPIATLLNEIKVATGEDKSLVEMWREAEYWIRRGTVMTQEDFYGLPEVLQSYFGSVASFKELALQEESQLPNERARFLRNAEPLAKRVETQKQLPADVTKLINGMFLGSGDV